MEIRPGFSALSILLICLSILANASPTPREKRQETAWNSPSYYPAPRGGWVPDWADSYRYAAAIVSGMTLAEKVNVTTGKYFSPLFSQLSSQMLAT